jgi:metal-responsive CopG/Arc/MetJ family transcriptional regulator
MMAETIKTMNVRLEQETVEQLDWLASNRYRKVSRSQAIRFLIEDAWKEDRDASKVVIPSDAG